jgi:hypothetical protein
MIASHESMPLKICAAPSCGMFFLGPAALVLRGLRQSYER